MDIEIAGPSRPSAIHLEAFMLRARPLVMALSALALAAGTGAATAGPVQADVGASAGAGAGAGADARELGFADCPTLSELPEGADPAKWRCEAMTATGHLTLGRVEVPIDRPLAITFAEGSVDGEFRQVFGAMAATPLRVRGTPLSITPRYGGYSDFESNDERRGELDLTFRISGPGVPRGCSIGTDAAPVHLVLKETDPSRVVSPDPLIVAFGVADNRFAAPGTSGCGRLGPVLDKVLRLPAPAGVNGIDLDARVALRSYGAVG
ncbi:hypothetical protein OOK29_48280 [Streptomyces phaeochromogenes]|uniref:hypothetical protein n=1 Tax=Streptomyces phaeochromogenes TaxID=1923 RepID=UPI00225B03B7|nr:hypothetical protein [Streptomyces phaeochromogenes]MCX5605925.1 hypothetical protein [Streptomyces phaeochromogenes]